MAKKDWYQVKQETPSRWQVIKLDEDLRQVTIYHVARIGDGEEMVCTCFAGNKSTCRHRKMIPIFKANAAIGTNAMYQFDSDKWMEPPEVDV